jgi:DNA mismatch repair protein MutL
MLSIITAEGITHAMSIRRLPKTVSATILSTSSVQSQVSVLKELLENAIDAIMEIDTLSDTNTNLNKNAQIYVEVDRASAGLDFLMVKDTGCGVAKVDRNLMCLNYTTSKLKSIDELSNGVHTCGFRGEALNFIARLSKTLRISTKTKDDMVEESWSVNNLGLVISDIKSSPGIVGTTVKVTGLFQSTPVRYKFLKEKRLKLLKEIEDMIIKFALVYRNIRFQLRYVKLASNGKIINIENKSYSNKITRIQFLNEILEIKNKNWLFSSQFEFEINCVNHGKFLVKVDVLLPKMQAKDIPNTKYKMKILTVNNRLMNLSLSFAKSVSNKINEAYASNILLSPSVWYISMGIPSENFDCNIEPEKSNIMIANEEMLLSAFKEKITLIVKQEHDVFESDKVETNSNEEKTEELLKVSNNENLDSISSNILTDQLSNPIISNIQKGYTEINNLNIDPTKSTESDKLINSIDTALSNSEKFGDVVIDIPIDNPHDSGIDFDHEWSKTVHDTSGLSSELDTVEQPISELNDIEPIDSNHISIFNPWTIAALSKEIKDSKLNLDDTLVELEDTSKSTRVLSDISFNINKNLNPIERKQNKNPIKTLKQMALSSYATYHIPETLKSSNTATIEKPDIRLPKILESSQNTINEYLPVNFEFSSANCNNILSDDEKWVNRSGIPSIEVINGARQLYEKVSHTLANKSPTLNDLDIYQFK